jgi:hypothetical protein
MTDRNTNRNQDDHEVNPDNLDFRPSVETQILHDTLKPTTIGECITYAKLNDAIGAKDANVQGKHGGHLRSARRALERQGIVFGVLRGVGLRRLDSPQIIRTGQKDIDGIRRRARRSARRIAKGVGDFDQLSQADKVAHNTTISVLGALSFMADRSARPVIEAEAAKAQAKIDVGDALKLFARK